MSDVTMYGRWDVGLVDVHGPAASASSGANSASSSPTTYLPTYPMPYTLPAWPSHHLLSLPLIQIYSPSPFTPHPSPFPPRTHIPHHHYSVPRDRQRNRQGECMDGRMGGWRIPHYCTLLRCNATVGFTLFLFEAFAARLGDIAQSPTALARFGGAGCNAGC